MFKNNQFKASGGFGSVLVEAMGGKVPKNLSDEKDGPYPGGKVMENVGPYGRMLKTLTKDIKEIGGMPTAQAAVMKLIKKALASMNDGEDENTAIKAMMPPNKDQKEIFTRYFKSKDML